MLQLKKTVAAAVLGLGFVGFAQAADYVGDLGELSLTKWTISDYFQVLGSVGMSFEQTVTFTVADDLLALVGSQGMPSTLNLTLGNAPNFGASTLTVSLFKGDDLTAPALFAVDWADVANQKFTLDSSKYTFLVSGVTSGSLGSAYTLTVSSTAGVIPEPETYAMLLAGLGVVGMVARRRKMAVN